MNDTKQIDELHEHLHEHLHDHEHPHTHEHIHEQHDHAHVHPHGHTHNPEDVKAIVNRLAKACGHLESVKRMVEDGRDCSEVLVQLAAVKAAINNAGKEILKEHISHCIVEAVEENDSQAIEELNKAIDKFIK
ncbi:MAG: metal-sensing transcriptional repressor [Lachnospira sp.]|nr:metal-sensing transcriptional repressor [Lachnospira sp.]